MAIEGPPTQFRNKLASLKLFDLMNIFTVTIVGMIMVKSGLVFSSGKFRNFSCCVMLLFYCIYKTSDKNHIN